MTPFPAVHRILSEPPFTFPVGKTQELVARGGGKEVTDWGAGRLLFISSTPSYFASASALPVFLVSTGKPWGCYLFSVFPLLSSNKQRGFFPGSAGEARNRLLLGRAITLLTSSPPARLPDRPFYFLSSLRHLLRNGAVVATIKINTLQAAPGWWCSLHAVLDSEEEKGRKELMLEQGNGP